MLRLALILLGMALCFTGCMPPSIYSKTHYEELVYLSYAKPEKATPEMQVLQLQKDIQKAASKNKPLPPGFHAHLGYLYYQLGQLDQSRQEFETEKTQFPESAVFIDRLLANFAKK